MSHYLRFTLFTLLITLLIHPGVVSAANLTGSVSISTEAQAAIQNHAFTLVYNQKNFTANAAEAKTWYQIKNDTLTLKPGAIYNFLNVKISPTVNSPGVSSRFAYVDGNLHLIAGGTKGQIVDGEKTSLAIRAALAQGQSQAKVYLKTDRPSVFSAADFQKLSFPDLLASGESNFAGSPANRIHNIVTATARFHGLVVMPNEEFSFNRYLGSVDAANGYLPELVIKDNVTTPEYGGGICQVSTTAFRAAMQAGLKITERHSHSYPVSYYGTPGYDATVYQPSPDLRFVNDTGNPVYLTTQVVGTRVIFNVWGTDDGRQVTINGPFVTKSLPDGSIEAAVAQIITKAGQTIREQNFVSKYQPAENFPTVVAANQG